MIYKAQFETKRSRVDYDACDIRFSVGLSKEDFDHLRTNLLEESKYIKPYLHMLDRNTPDIRRLFPTREECLRTCSTARLISTMKR